MKRNLVLTGKSSKGSRIRISELEMNKRNDMKFEEEELQEIR